MQAGKLLARKKVIAWCLFDWATSPFSVLITTFIFANYFTQQVAINNIIGTAQWGEVNGAAGLIVAFLSPVLGAIADYDGRRKPWLMALTPIMIISAAALWFVKPEHDYVVWALTWVMVGTMAIEISMVFYNAMLNELVPANFLGRLSGLGWGFGYVGGIVALIIALLLIQTLPSEAQPVRLCGPLVAVWVLAFAWPLFAFTPDRPFSGQGWYANIKQGIESLIKTLSLLRFEYRNILIFLIARMLYIDGLITVFAFGGIYAAGVFHMTLTEVIEFGIGMNISAGLGAVIFGWLDDSKGPKLTILATLSLMVACGIGILLVDSKLWFWILGMGLSLGVGPVQAASRSLLIRIAPAHLITELFGLYNLSGRATSFIGPWVLALFTHWFYSQRVGMSTVFLFMVTGGIMLALVKNAKIS
ncbi:MAG: MFS transporter [Proteobacteria bacterium]|nr:MFS transporter [Pseudomonadota bacterium]